jgi:uncharacterized phage protein gp47/JayE
MTLVSITSTGFSRLRLAGIKTYLDEQVTSVLGPVNTAADSVVGQVLGVVSAALDDALETIETAYNSSYPATAEGVSLDGVVQYVGLERIAAAPTTAIAMCYGTESTAVPAGSLVRSNSGAQFVSDYDIVISRARAGHVLIDVNTIEVGAVYQIIAGGVSVSYEAVSGDTAADILAGLAAEFDADDFTATVSDETLDIHKPDGESAFTLTVGSRLTIATLGTPCAFTALELGATALPVGALNTLDTSISGWTAVGNLTAGATGRAIETDEELRVRHSESVSITGAATLSAIRARIAADVENVTYVKVYENRTDTIDAFNLPPHSIEAIVSGGADTDIATKLFEVKPAGIETYGTDDVTVTDENGDGQTVYFTRAASRYIHVRVTINAYNPEEDLTADYQNAIKAAVVAAGAQFGIGDDVVVQRFFGPIYGATDGLGSITVECAVTTLPTDSPTYGTSNISIGRGQVSAFDASRVTLVTP